MEELLNYSADIFASNVHKQNALFYVVSSEGTAALRWLLQKEVYFLNEEDVFGKTPLDGRKYSNTSDEIIPSFCGNVALLLAYGAEWTSESMRFHTDDNLYATSYDLKDFF